MAHGDLQHGNVLLVPGTRAGTLHLRLIDYDGLCIPALAEQPSGEVGHPNYQHPERLSEGTYNAEMDRFSHLLIYSALRCLQSGGKELWERHDNGENLLFRQDDFAAPTDSALLRELWSLPDADARTLIGHLLLASLAPIEEVPLLDDLLSGTTVRPLTAQEQEQVQAMLGPGVAGGKRSSRRRLLLDLEEAAPSGRNGRSARLAETRSEDEETEGAGLVRWVLNHPWVIPWLGLALTLLLLFLLWPFTPMGNRPAVPENAGEHREENPPTPSPVPPERENK